MPAATLADLPDLSIRQLCYLLAVADEPTWARAADRVGVSPSALSQGLAELERRIGVELFESIGRRRVVRRSATPVLDHARHVVALTRDLVDWSDRLRHARAGRVRLGLIDVAAVVHCADAILEFSTERPDVAMTVSVAPSVELLEQLGEATLDLVVCVEPPSPVYDIVTTPLLDEPLHVVAPPGVVIGRRATWGPWLTFPASSHTRHVIIDTLRKSGAPLEIAAESHQPAVLAQMTRLGLGWTVLPSHGLSPELSIGPALVSRRIVIARRLGTVSDPAVDDLADRIRATVGSTLDDE